MPNRPLVSLREHARAQAGQYLESLPDGYFARLPEDQIPEKKNGTNVVAWKGKIPCGDVQIEIVLGLPASFPDELPNIYLQDSPSMIPHMMATRENFICFADPQEVFPLPERPVEILKDSLRLASETINKGLTGSNLEDFEREFERYWTDHETVKWISLIEPGGEPRTIAMLVLDKNLGGAIRLFGETKDQCRKWLKNVQPVVKMPASQESLCLPLKRVFHPPFPKKNKEVYRLLSEIDREALKALCEFLTKHKAKPLNYVVFSVPARDNQAFGGWVHTRPPRKKRSDPIRPGFRDDKITGSMQLTVCFQNQDIMRAEIERANPARLQARVGSKKSAKLLDKKVLIIGCGSIGCRIAHMLALGGVGSLLLADNDVYSLENVARHILPVSFIGHKKSEALAKVLKAQSPHLEVESFQQDFYKVMYDYPEVFKKADLVVAATANRNLEFRLNSLLTKGEEPGPAIYAWTEALGIASHSLLTVPGKGGCMRCAFIEQTNDIRFRYQVDTRLASEVMIHEEGCGATFQPFSALVAEQAALNAAKMALSYLHGDLAISSRWHYLGDLNSARDGGIPLSEHYKGYCGEQLLKASLPKYPNCPECRG